MRGRVDVRGQVDDGGENTSVGLIHITWRNSVEVLCDAFDVFTSMKDRING